MTSPPGNTMSTPPPWISWGAEASPTFLSSSPFIQEILCRNCRRRDLPDLIASLPPSADRDIPRSDAIDIPGTGGRRRANTITVSSAPPPSPQIIGQELRRIADDFDLHYRASAAKKSSLKTARSLSLQFIR